MDSVSGEVLGEDWALEEAEDGAGAGFCPSGAIRTLGECLMAFPSLIATRIPMNQATRLNFLLPGHPQLAARKNKTRE